MMIRNLLFVLIVALSAVSCRYVLGRKTSDAIKNNQALEYYRKAQEERYSGELQNAIELLNIADSLEPKNAIIIHERGLIKFAKKLDIRSAFADLEKSIEHSTDKRDLQYRYVNRGLCYMEIGDIKSACTDWSKAGRSGHSYLEKYCSLTSDTAFYDNTNAKVEVKFELLNDSARITSPHNPSSMSRCEANIIIQNNNKDLIIIGSSLDYGLEKDSSSLYLEAQLQNGEKFMFYTGSTYSYFPTKKNLILKKGDTFSQKQNITYLHQFPYAGIYKIRVALRPSTRIEGLEHTYYSNWQILPVEY